MYEWTNVNIMLGCDVMDYQHQLKISFKNGKWCCFNINEDTAKLIVKLIKENKKKDG